jgi:hypothetical protein
MYVVGDSYVFITVCIKGSASFATAENGSGLSPPRRCRRGDEWVLPSCLPKEGIMIWPGVYMHTYIYAYIDFRRDAT